METRAAAKLAGSVFQPIADAAGLVPCFAKITSSKTDLASSTAGIAGHMSDAIAASAQLYFGYYRQPLQ